MARMLPSNAALWQKTLRPRPFDPFTPEAVVSRSQTLALTVRKSGYAHVRETTERKDLCITEYMCSADLYFALNLKNLEVGFLNRKDESLNPSSRSTHEGKGRGRSWFLFRAHNKIHSGLCA